MRVLYYERAQKQDFNESVKWYRLSAEQGYKYAQNRLGAAYYLGQGVSQDDKASIKWYRLAAEQGDAEAQYNLGLAYGLGRGIQQDQVQAYVWLSLASDQGHKEAVKPRTAILKSISPEQLEEAQRLSREYAEKFGKK